MTPIVYQFYINCLYFSFETSLEETEKKLSAIIEKNEFEILLLDTEKEEW